MLFAELVEIVDPQPHTAALNMAIDEVLLRQVEAPTLRIYCWAERAVSFGYFGRHVEVQTHWPGHALMRRWTGGGSVPHGDDLTYTLLVPGGDAFGQRNARESYRLIHERVAALLVTEGCAAQVTPVVSARRSDACFENPVEFDVVAASGKVAGAAQRRTRWGLLHQGSIQVRGLAEAAAGRFSRSFAPKINARDLRPGELSAAEALAAEKYATDAWLRRV